jgi:hypothetical protein
MVNTLYDKLNKKLDTLWNTKHRQTKRQQEHGTHTPPTFYTRLKNMSNITFNKEEESILELGLNYAFENPVKYFLQKSTL